MKLVILIFLLLCHGSAYAIDLKVDWKDVEGRLKKEKISDSFISDLKKNYDSKSIRPVLRLNYLTFKRSPIRKNKVSDVAIRKTAAFISANSATLEKAEKQYGVPPGAVASLLWIESQYGAIKGDFHLASVFVQIVESENKSNLAEIKKMAKHHSSFSKMTADEFENTFNARAKRKAEWAVNQLKEMETMAKKDSKATFKLRGSFAGAFGLPQFLPSSFNSFAVADKGGMPNLFEANDAILSVAHFLNASGWGKKTEDQLAALFKYNNSTEYAKTILELSEAVKKSLREKSESISAKK